MLKQLVKKASTHLEKIQHVEMSPEYLHLIAGIYEDIQRTDYLPVEPQNFLKKVLQVEATELLALASQNMQSNFFPIVIILNFFTNKHKPELKTFQKYILDSRVYETYPLLISSMVFHSKSYDLIDTFLKFLTKKKPPLRCAQTIDFHVLCCFLYSRKLKGKTRNQKANHFKQLTDDLTTYHQAAVSPARLLAYDAIWASMENDPTRAIALSAKSQKYQEKFCTPLAAINNFYEEADFSSSQSYRPHHAVPVSYRIRNHGDIVVIVACDETYYKRYLDVFCSSSIFTAGVILHIHCVDFLLTDAEIDRIEKKYDLKINTSSEKYNLTSSGDGFVTWCATSRFRILPKILETFPCCVISDIDGYIEQSLFAYLEHPNTGVYLNGALDNDDFDLRFPWNTYYAGNIVIKEDQQTVDFCHQLAFFSERKLLEKIERSEKAYYFDQCILASLTVTATCEIHSVPMFFIQEESDPSKFSKNRVPVKKNTAIFKRLLYKLGTLKP